MPSRVLVMAVESSHLPSSLLSSGFLMLPSTGVLEVAGVENWLGMGMESSWRF